MLEMPSMLTNYVGKYSSDGAEVAVFCWDDFVMLDNNGAFYTVRFFRVDVDLSTGKLKRDFLDGETLSASDTLLLVFFTFVFGSHPKQHAAANWAVLPELDKRGLTDEMARVSVITVLYNYFGVRGFGRVLDRLHSVGFLRCNYRAYEQLFDHTLNSGIESHAHLVEIVHSSQLAKFVYGLRRIFFQEFENHKAEFAEIDKEGLFIGTAMHSLEHYQGEKLIEDALWLAPTSTKFEAMAELLRVCRVSLMGEIPTVGVPKHFRESQHPFFRAVYQRCHGMDEELSSALQTCVVK